MPHAMNVTQRGPKPTSIVTRRGERITTNRTMAKDLRRSLRLRRATKGGR